MPREFSHLSRGIRVFGATAIAITANYETYVFGSLEDIPYGFLFRLSICDDFLNGITTGACPGGTPNDTRHEFFSTKDAAGHPGNGNIIYAVTSRAGGDGELLTWRLGTRIPNAVTPEFGVVAGRTDVAVSPHDRSRGEMLIVSGRDDRNTAHGISVWGINTRDVQQLRHRDVYWSKQSPACTLSAGTDTHVDSPNRVHCPYTFSRPNRATFSPDGDLVFVPSDGAIGVYRANREITDYYSEVSANSPATLVLTELHMAVCSDTDLDVTCHVQSDALGGETHAEASPDGDLLFTTSLANSAVAIWRVNSGDGTLTLLRVHTDSNALNRGSPLDLRCRWWFSFYLCKS